MAAFNVSLDDSSPLISYSPSGAWTDTPKGDTLAQSYSAQSLHSASQNGATASFSFNGTGVWLYGGARSNYGSYSVQIDGKPISQGSAASSSDSVGKLLGGTAGLDMGPHTVVLTNGGGGPIDIDSLIFQTQMSAPSQSVSQTSLDDVDAGIVYSGSPAWSIQPGPTFSNGSIHYSQQNGAQAQLTFTGDAVSLYGGSSFDHGDYTIDLDGQKFQFNGGANGLARLYHPSTLLFFASGLGSESHSLTITNSGQGATTFLDIDSLMFYNPSNTPSSNGTPGNPSGSVSSPQSSSSTSNQPTSSATSTASGASASAPTSKGLSPAGAAAIAVVIILILLALIALFLFFIVRRRLREADAEQGAPPPPPEAESPGFGLPIQDPKLEAAKEFYNYGPGSASDFFSPNDLPPAAAELPVLDYSYSAREESSFPREEDVVDAIPAPAYDYPAQRLSVPTRGLSVPSRGQSIGGSSLRSSYVEEDYEPQETQLSRNKTTNTRWSQSSYDSDESETTIQSSDQVVLEPELPALPKPAMVNPRNSRSGSGSPKDDELDDITGYYLHLRDTTMTVGPAPLRVSRARSYGRDDDEFDQIAL